MGEEMGIKHVESGPLVRSSYHADEAATSIVIPAWLLQAGESGNLDYFYKDNL